MLLPLKYDPFYGSLSKWLFMGSILIFNGFYALHAQSISTVEEWFLSRKSTLTEGLGIEYQGNYNSSWIRELEFRTETDEFILDRQEYLIRFRPTLPRERKAQQRLIDVSKRELALEKIDFERKVNRIILEELLQVWETKEELSIHQELLIILRDQKTLLAAKLENKDFDLKDFSKLEEEIWNLEQDIIEKQIIVSQWRENMNVPQNIGIAEPILLFQRLSRNILISSDPLEREKSQFENEKIEAELELEKAEESRIFDFFQVRYDGPHNDILRERVSVGFSLQLPYSSGNRLRQEELRLEQILNIQSAEYDRRLDSIHYIQEIEKVNVLNRRFETKQRRIGELEEEIESFMAYGLDPVYNRPDVLLYKKEQLLNYKIDQVTIKKELYNQFFDLLTEYLTLEPKKILSIIVP